MNIAIMNRQRRLKVSTKRLRAAALKILNDLGCTSSELSVAIVGDRTMRILNRDYLQKDRPTNVISFSMQEGEFAALHPELLGDIVISADTAAREAAEGEITFEERLVFLLLHGILHLTGYDHERSGEQAARRMEAKEQELYLRLQESGLV
jgi:probable rRNA maturation factor